MFVHLAVGPAEESTHIKHGRVLFLVLFLVSLQVTEKEANVCLGTLSLLLVLHDAYDGVVEPYGVCVCVCVCPCVCE